MRTFPILLCALVAATGLAPADAAAAGCATIKTFLEMNAGLYEYMGEALPGKVPTAAACAARRRCVCACRHMLSHRPLTPSAAPIPFPAMQSRRARTWPSPCLCRS